MWGRHRVGHGGAYPVDRYGMGLVAYPRRGLSAQASCARTSTVARATVPVGSARRSALALVRRTERA